MKTMAGLLASMVVTGCVTQLPDDTDDSPPAPVGESEAALSNNVETAYNFFVSKGLTPIQSAGIVGNLMEESSVIPTEVEFSGGPGRGIAQWSTGGRWDTAPNDNVTSYASGKGLDRWALMTQLDFIWFELTTIGYGYSSLEAATTVAAAEYAFQSKYEVCGTCAQSARVANANQVLAEYGSGTSTGTGSGTGTGTGSGTGTGTGSGTTIGAAPCYSGTLGETEPENTCVQSKYDDLWYQCNNGSWIDRWSDPEACVSVHPL